MVASEITNMWVCSECEVMDDIWYVYMSGRSLLLHKSWCPQFLHTSCNGLISACQVRSPRHIPLFLYLIQSCHYLHFSINSYLTPLHALHLIRKCFTSSISPLSHSVHFLSSLVNLSFFPRPPATLCVIEMEQIIMHT